MADILIGPAGSGGGAPENFKKIKDLGLDAVEIAFTYGIWLTAENARKIKQANKSPGLRISIHAPYYINLNSPEKEKIEASKSRILKSCEIGHYLGAGEIVFHPGFYLKNSPEETFENILEQMKELQKIIKNNGWSVLLSPETTGKPTQFGSLDELIELRKNTHCSITVDFAHLKARENGVLDYPGIMKKLKTLEPFHSHFSGIEYTSRGERKHLLTGEEEIRELLENLVDHNLNTTIINESPSPLEDSLKMKKILKKMING